MSEELRLRLEQVEKDFDGKAFREIIERVKKDKMNDDELLKLISRISLKRFNENVTFTLGVPAGNMLEIIFTIAAIVMAYQSNSDWIIYLITFILMGTLHPLSHFFTGSLAGIRFTHYYLDGPARIEPTLRIDYYSYLKASGKQRGFMHLSGVVGTVAAPLIVAIIALSRGASGTAMNLIVLFFLLIVFELLTSTKKGDLKKVKRELNYI